MWQISIKKITYTKPWCCVNGTRLLLLFILLRLSLWLMVPLYSSLDSAQDQLWSNLSQQANDDRSWWRDSYFISKIGKAPELDILSTTVRWCIIQSNKERTWLWGSYRNFRLSKSVHWKGAVFNIWRNFSQLYYWLLNLLITCRFQSCCVLVTAHCINNLRRTLLSSGSALMTKAVISLSMEVKRFLLPRRRWAPTMFMSLRRGSLTNLHMWLKSVPWLRTRTDQPAACLYGCFREREQKGLVTSYDKKINSQ